MTRCPHLLEVELLPFCEASAARKAEIAAHLELCDECRAIWHANESIVQMLREENECLQPSDAWMHQTLQFAKPGQTSNISDLRRSTVVWNWTSRIAIALALAASVVIAIQWRSPNEQDSRVAIQENDDSRNPNQETKLSEPELSETISPRAHDGFLAVRDALSTENIEIVWVLPVTHFNETAESQSKGQIQ